MNRQHRYRQEGIRPEDATSYSPTTTTPAPPVQGQLALDGAVLGPLFDQQQTQPEEGQG